jgi:phenylalanyl-tRNA synthetase beta chain
MVETLNFLLTSKEVQYDAFGIAGSNMLSVESSKSIEHEILRDSIIPLLLQSLSNNIHEQYPRDCLRLARPFIDRQQ